MSTDRNKVPFSFYKKKFYNPIKILGRVYQTLLGIKDYILTLYILVSWTGGIGERKNLKKVYEAKVDLMKEKDIKKELELYNSIINYHRLKYFEIVLSLIFLGILTIYFFAKVYIHIHGLKIFSLDFENMPNFIKFLLSLNDVLIFFLFLFLLPIISILLFFLIKLTLKILYKLLLRILLRIVNCKPYEWFIKKFLGAEKDFIETLLLSLGILPSDLNYYIKIQRMVYFLNSLKFFLFFLIITADIFLILKGVDTFEKTSRNHYEHIFRDTLLILLGTALTSLPFYFAFYNLLERILLPRIHLVIIKKNEKKKFEELKSNFYLNKKYPNLSVRNYYFYILIPSIIKETFNRHGYKLYDVIENILRRTAQYYLVNRFQSILFYVGNSIVYFFMISFFFLAFMFLYAVKDLLEEYVYYFNFESFGKEIISVILIVLLISWSIFFLRLTIFLFPYHLWSYLSDKVRHTKILDNIHILSFTINKGVKEINPHDIVNYSFSEYKRLDLVFNLTSSLIIAIILQILLSQIDLG